MTTESDVKKLKQGLEHLAEAVESLAEVATDLSAGRATVTTREKAAANASATRVRNNL